MKPNHTIKSVIASVVLLGILSSCGNSGTAGTSKADSSTAPSYEAETTEIVSEESTETETTQAASEQETTTEISAETTEEETEAVTEQEEIQLQGVSETANGLEWSWNGCTITFPPSWKGRIITEDNRVYCKKCWDDTEGNGELFTLFAKTAEELAEGGGPNYEYVIGESNGRFILPATPLGVTYDIQNMELSNEYNNLYNDLQNIFPNARCDGTPDMRPVSTREFEPFSDKNSGLNGTWEATELIGQMSPMVIFNESTKQFAYYEGLTVLKKGAFWVNRDIDSFEWSSGQWGAQGLVFIESDLYKVTYYYSAPLTMSFERIAGNSCNITDYSYVYLNDSTRMELDPWING